MSSVIISDYLFENYKTISEEEDKEEKIVKEEDEEDKKENQNENEEYKDDNEEKNKIEEELKNNDKNMGKTTSYDKFLYFNFIYLFLIFEYFIY